MSGEVTLNLSLKGEKEAEKHRLEAGRAGRRSVELGGGQARTLHGLTGPHGFRFHTASGCCEEQSVWGWVGGKGCGARGRRQGNKGRVVSKGLFGVCWNRSDEMDCGQGRDRSTQRWLLGVCVEQLPSKEGSERSTNIRI